MLLNLQKSKSLYFIKDNLSHSDYIFFYKLFKNFLCSIGSSTCYGEKDNMLQTPLKVLNNCTHYSLNSQI